jgi:predicted RNase H-like nuclease
MRTAGIDGCKAGWMLISFDQDNKEYRVLRTDEELKEVFNSFDRILIDMPIGLEDETYHRECDQLLRKELGSEYSSSVFTPPIRPALEAPTYVEANIISYDYTEKKLSLQAWNITPKIKLIDRLLREQDELKDKVFESHPELLYQKLNGGMIYQKKNLKKGIKHRLELITAEEKIADDFFREIKEEYRRNEVAEDDIVDAMVLAYYALKSVGEGLKTIPSEPEKDSEGQIKAIHYV